MVSSQDVALEVRALIKAEFPELKKKTLKRYWTAKSGYSRKPWWKKPKPLQAVIGTAQFDDFNQFDEVLKEALKQHRYQAGCQREKQLLDAITWKNPEAEPVISKVWNRRENPLYGQFSYQGKVVEFVQDGDLRDAENIALNPKVSTTELIEDCILNVKSSPMCRMPGSMPTSVMRKMARLVLSVMKFRLIVISTCTQPPRDLSEIDADLDAVSAEIMQLLQEVHS